MKTLVRRSLVYLVVPGVTMLTVSAVRLTRADTIVVPPYLADTEGNDAAASTPCPAGGIRTQMFYPASDFAALPDDRRTFVSMAFRPDHLFTTERTAHLPDFELRLSTTTRTFETLNWTFADNGGADEVVVFSGDLDTHTDGSGLPEGPRAFDYLIEFQTPFVYDPDQGNLLVDMHFGTATGIPAFDADSRAEGHGVLYGIPRSSSQAIGTMPGAIAVQFGVVPEPSTVVYMFVLAIGLTSIAWRRKRKA